MGLAKRREQAVGMARHQDQVDVIGHQAVGPDFGRRLGSGLGEKPDIGLIIGLGKEGFQVPVAPLGNVMGNARHHDARQSSHEPKLAQAPRRVEE